MATEVAANILVRGRAVPTGLRINAFDRLQITATGRVNFGGITGCFLSDTVLPPDGDNHRTPSHFPAPQLRKNSLVVEVRTRGGWAGDQWSRFYQGGSNRTVVPGDPGEVFLLANDATPDDNCDGWNVTVVRTFPDPGRPVLGIDTIEVVQSIQRPDNSVPLVSGKTTVARVYPTSGSATALPRVTGRCVARLPNGTTVGIGPLNAAGSSAFITARARGGHFRDSPQSSLNFVLGQSPPGPLSLTAELWVDGQRNQPGRSAIGGRTVTIGPSPTLTIQPFLVALPAHGLGAPSGSAATAVLTAALGRWPFGADRTVIRPFRPWTFGRRLDVLWGWHQLVYELGSAPFPLFETRVAFCMDIGSPTNGMAMYRPFIAVPTCVSTIRGNPAVDVTACAHELGHTLGLNHVDACDAGIPHSSRLPRVTEEPTWRNDNNSLVGSGASEIMSYCDTDRWPSIAAYEFAIFGRHR